jgi:cell division protein FtsB
MTSIGKKILSAFVEVQDEQRPAPVAAVPVYPPTTPATSEDALRFRQHFDQLFADANLPGPDYFEFSRMIEAMRVIQDEHARYLAAFAGLQAQGLEREKLLATAQSYLELLDKDAANFHATVDHALNEKVKARQLQIEEKTKRIGELTKEITDLHEQIGQLTNEVKQSEEKIDSNTHRYATELAERKNRITTDVEKIKQYIH